MKACLGTGILSLIVLLSGCGLFGTSEQLQELQSVCRVSGTVHSQGRMTGPYMVAVYDATAMQRTVTPQVLDYVITGERGNWFFALLPGEYRILAFRDVDESVIHDPGELGTPSNAADAFQCVPGAITGGLEIIVPDRTLAMASEERGLPDERPDPALVQGTDVVSLGGLTAYGAVTTLDDPRFSPAIGRSSVWRPVDFIRGGNTGVYFLEPYDAGRIPVLFIHGMGGSPRVFEEIINSLDASIYQPWVYYYPSGLSLGFSAEHLSQIMNELEIRHQVSRYFVVGYSMGGLVGRAFLQTRKREDGAAQVPAMITLSTPWDGHWAAERGVNRSPVVLPVWRDMVPGSEFLRGLFPEAVPRDEPALHVILGLERETDEDWFMDSDGVLSLATMLTPEVEKSATSLHTVETTHRGILRHDEAIAQVNALLRHWRELAETAAP